MENGRFQNPWARERPNAASFFLSWFTGKVRFQAVLKRT